MSAVAALVTSLALPLGPIWANVSPSGGTLLVQGYPNPGRGCVFMRVDPVSLRSTRFRAGCADTGRLTPRVRITRTRWWPVSVGGKRAFEYQDASDTRPQWAYGGGSLWLYDVATRSGAQLLRYSLRTHRLQQRMHFPVRLFRPVLAANDDGAWLMAATNGGVSGRATAALYHVAPGAKRPTVLQRGARAALWMTASAHTLWLETVTRYSTFRLWRYDGTHGRQLWRLHRIVVANATYGGGALWGTTPACGPPTSITQIKVVKLDAGTGARSVVASAPLHGCDEVGPGTYFRGAFWVVDDSKLLRITP